jgi:AAHS family 4-hydroxybenzoate transporter-like MFS transporter
MAKIGSIAGPTLGGLILATKMPVREIFICLALCPALMALCTWTIGRLYGSLRAAPAQARVA